MASGHHQQSLISLHAFSHTVHFAAAGPHKPPWRMMSILYRANARNPLEVLASKLANRKVPPRVPSSMHLGHLMLRQQLFPSVELLVHCSYAESAWQISFPAFRAIRVLQATFSYRRQPADHSQLCGICQHSQSRVIACMHVGASARCVLRFCAQIA